MTANTLPTAPKVTHSLTSVFQPFYFDYNRLSASDRARFIQDMFGTRTLRVKTVLGSIGKFEAHGFQDKYFQDANVARQLATFLYLYNHPEDWKNVTGCLPDEQASINGYLACFKEWFLILNGHFNHEYAYAYLTLAYTNTPIDNLAGVLKDAAILDRIAGYPHTHIVAAKNDRQVLEQVVKWLTNNANPTVKTKIEQIKARLNSLTPVVTSRNHWTDDQIFMIEALAEGNDHSVGAVLTLLADLHKVQPLSAIRSLSDKLYKMVKDNPGDKGLISLHKTACQVSTLERHNKLPYNPLAPKTPEPTKTTPEPKPIPMVIPEMKNLGPVTVIPDPGQSYALPEGVTPLPVKTTAQVDPPESVYNLVASLEAKYSKRLDRTTSYEGITYVVGQGLMFGGKPARDLQANDLALDEFISRIPRFHEYVQKREAERAAEKGRIAKLKATLERLG